LYRTLRQVGFGELSLKVKDEFRFLENEEKKEPVTNSKAAPKSTTKRTEIALPHVSHDLVTFQLDHLIHKFQTNPVSDPRVNNFNPDEWQKKLLDIVDTR
jgi:hypothetical protein